MKTTLSFVIEVLPMTDRETGKPQFNILNSYEDFKRCRENQKPYDWQVAAKVYEIFFEVEDPRLPVNKPETIGTHEVTVKEL
jgi:hypothetical protein